MLALKLMPYRVVARWMPREGVRVAPAWRKRQLSSNIRWAARWLPNGTCLPQALTGYLFFSLLGLECRIRIGVTRAADRGFRAHATLLSGDDVVVGDGPEWQDFVPLTELRPGR